MSEEKLKKNLNLEMDEEGNFYDPLEKDNDNDGIPDRYDHEFRDSDYFESTYDVEDNLHGKESEEKPSILGQIKEMKENDSRTKPEKEQKDNDRER